MSQELLRDFCLGRSWPVSVVRSESFCLCWRPDKHSVNGARGYIPTQMQQLSNAVFLTFAIHSHETHNDRQKTSEAPEASREDDEQRSLRTRLGRRVQDMWSISCRSSNRNVRALHVWRSRNSERELVAGRLARARVHPLRTKGAEVMDDPTYDKDQIRKNPAWQLAWSLSEIQNANAPLGWGNYISPAECLLANYDIKRKKSAP